MLYIYKYVLILLYACTHNANAYTEVRSTYYITDQNIIVLLNILILEIRRKLTISRAETMVIYLYSKIS
jgi:hypothetical protein